MQRKNTLLLACFFISATCLSQQYPFVHYTPKDGLVNNRVRKAFQDSRGVMYFMTYGGLSVYDGARFRNYTVDNGLSSDLVNDMIEMGKDTIWIACNTRQVNILNAGVIDTLVTANKFTPIINKFIKSSDGYLYVIADDGFFRFQNNRFEKLPLLYPGTQDAGSFLFDLIEWGPYFLIIPDLVMNTKAPARLFLFDRRSNKIVAVEETNAIYSICKTNSNNILLCKGQGVEQLDTSALRKGFIRYVPASIAYRDLPSLINFMMTDIQDNLWIYSGYNVVTKIETSGSRKYFSTLNGLGSNNLSGIFQDREGSIWFSLNGSGADKLVRDNLQLHEKINGYPVKVLYTDENSDSVCIYSNGNKRIRFLRSAPGDYHAFPGEQLTSIAVDSKKGKIYISEGTNLYLLRYHNNKFSDRKIVFKDSLSRGIGNIFIDPHGNPIVCGNPFLAVVIGDTLANNYPADYFTDQLAFDKNNRLWVAPRAGPIMVFSLHPEDPRHYLRLEKQFEKEFHNNGARSIAADANNNIWIGTRYDGLYRLHVTDDLAIKSVAHYSISEGLSDNFVTYLTCDRENSVWISTASGVDRIMYDQPEIHIENITRSNYIYQHILKTMVSQNGVAWSYSTEGYLMQIGKKTELNSAPPDLLVNEIRIGNRLINLAKQPAKFSYKQNSLLVSVAAPSFYDEKQIRYSYLLKGSGNEEWSEPSTYPVFNFINLHPGHYLLKLKAIFPAGRYADKEIEYSFVISPPWWQTTWFWLVLSMLVISLLIASIRAYYRRKFVNQRNALEKQQAIEKERTRIATDIHDDLGSGLSRIRYLGEMVKLKSSQQQDILPEIEKIAVYSDEMVDSMNEIVWALNKKNDTLEALIYYTRSFVVEYLTNNDLTCSVTIPDQIPFYKINGEMRRNIFLSVKESIHNIIKHASAKGVSMRFGLENGLHIDIHDNGKGIDWHKIRPFSNGLSNMRKRMEEMGATIRFSNENGTKVSFDIPMP